MTRALIGVLVLVCACNEGGPLTERPDAEGAPVDGAIPDGATDDSMSGPAVDMGGKTCGQVVKCLLPCGFTNFACDQMCVIGATPQALQEVGAIGLCAAQSCLLVPDAGGTSGLLPCLLQNCGTQVAACQGLIGF